MNKDPANRTSGRHSARGDGASSDAYAREGAESDYRHDSHAGNVGDVWKHVVWVTLLRSLQGTKKRLVVIETHSGAGRYYLQSTGEWQAGIGQARQLASERLNAMRSLAAYLQVQEAEMFRRRYLGSPLVAARVIGTRDRVVCFENDPDTAGRLASNSESDTRVEVRTGDGYAGALELLATLEREEAAVLLIDPPWSQKREWTQMPRYIKGLLADFPGLVIALWYPIKSYTRVAHLLGELSGTRGTALDLITTPLELRRNRLNGSGMLLFNNPASVIGDSALAGTALGPVCATHEGVWKLAISHL